MIYADGRPTAEFVPEIADNLTTDDSTKALSAKQGKVLNEKIDSIKGIKSVEITTTSNSNGDIAMNQFSAQGITDYTKIVNIIVKTPNACNAKMYSYSNILYIRLFDAYSNSTMGNISTTLRVFVMD